MTADEYREHCLKQIQALLPTFKVAPETTNVPSLKYRIFTQGGESVGYIYASGGQWWSTARYEDTIKYWVVDTPHCPRRERPRGRYFVQAKTLQAAIKKGRPYIRGKNEVERLREECRALLNKRVVPSRPAISAEDMLYLLLPFVDRAAAPPDALRYADELLLYRQKKEEFDAAGKAITDLYNRLIEEEQERLDDSKQ